MPGVNKVILVGYTGCDPELRYTQSGRAVANFRMATSERWPNREGEGYVNHTEWHKIVVWGKLAEICGQWLVKGKEIYIEGKLQTKMWEKNGQKQYTTEVVASQMVMLGKRDDIHPLGEQEGDGEGGEADKPTPF